MTPNRPKTVAIVPARGGSKGILRKNLVNLNGKPLIAYAIEAGLTCKEVDRVIVSTDDPEIAKVALKYGAEVPFRRPQELAQDDTPDRPVFLHLIEWLKETQGYNFEYLGEQWHYFEFNNIDFNMQTFDFYLNENLLLFLILQVL